MKGGCVAGVRLGDDCRVKMVLERQAARDTRLGELLVGMGVIDASELRAMLSLQKELRAAHGGALRDVLRQRFRLGRLLVDSGVIDEATLQRALADSRRTGRKLGEALVEAEAISAETLQHFLERQRRLVSVGLVGLALSAAAPPPVIAADAANLQVVASVLARALVDSMRVPSAVTISALDVERGYVDLADPIQVAIRSNHPGGVMLGLALNSPILSGAEVRSAGDGVRAAGSTVYIPQNGRGLQSSSVSLKVRLKLAPGATPGAIAFPVSLFLNPA